MPDPENKRKPDDERIKQLLTAWSCGDQTALDELALLVEADLRRLAKHYLAGERPGHTLQTDALINEAYVRLIEDAKHVQWQDRAHFVALAATLMRRVLVDHARKRGSDRRGGDLVRESFTRALAVPHELNVDTMALDEALTKLAARDERASRVVELRFFGGLSAAETAAVLGVSTDTVTREWNFAKSWLLRQLKGERDGAGKISTRQTALQ